jgi:hypothetical protein
MRLALALLLLFSLVHCQPSTANLPAGQCDKEHPLFDSNEWASAFSDGNTRLPGCLLITSGTKRDALLVSMDANGLLRGKSDSTTLPTSLPNETDKNQLVYTIYIFGKILKGNQKNREDWCYAQTSKSGEACDKKHDGKCWFSIQLTPQADGESYTCEIDGPSSEPTSPEPIEPTESTDANEPPGVPDQTPPGDAPANDEPPTQLEPITPDPTEIYPPDVTPPTDQPDSIPEQPMPPPWLHSVGGSNDDEIWSVAQTKQGDIIVVGSFEGSALFGSTILSSKGQKDIFVAKLDQKRNWVWAVRAGGSNDDAARDVAVDGSDNIYVIGTFQGIAEFGGTTLTSGDGTDVFVARLDKSGRWQPVKHLSSKNDVAAHSIVLDAKNNAYISGVFKGVLDFDGKRNNSLSGTYTGFIAKLNSSFAFGWVKTLGATPIDKKIYLAMRPISNPPPAQPQNLYVSSTFTGSFELNAASLTVQGGSRGTSVFVGSFDSQGRNIWYTQVTSSKNVFVGGLAIDNKDSVFALVSFGGDLLTGFPNNTTSPKAKGTQDLLVLRYDTSRTNQQPPGASQHIYGTNGVGELKGRALVWDPVAPEKVHLTGQILNSRGLYVGGVPRSTFPEPNLFWISLLTSTLKAADTDATKCQGNAIGNGISASSQGLYIVGRYQDQCVFGKRNYTTKKTGSSDGFIWKVR